MNLGEKNKEKPGKSGLFYIRLILEALMKWSSVSKIELRSFSGSFMMSCRADMKEANAGSGLFSGEWGNLSKDFLKSVEEQFGVADPSKVGSEEFDLSV